MGTEYRSCWIGRCLDDGIQAQRMTQGVVSEISQPRLLNFGRVCPIFHLDHIRATHSSRQGVALQCWIYSGFPRTINSHPSRHPMSVCAWV